MRGCAPWRSPWLSPDPAARSSCRAPAPRSPPTDPRPGLREIRARIAPLCHGQPGGSVRFDNKVAIVTGSAGGIGEAYARALAREGAAVVVADIDATRGQAGAPDPGAGGPGGAP